MKCKVKKAGFLLLCGMMLLGISSAKSNNLYVYLTNGTKQSFSVETVQKLTFTDNALVINQTSGNPVNVSYANLRFFSLKEFSNSGVDTQTITPVNAFPSVAVDKVTLTSETNICSVGIYDLQGRKLLELAPNVQQTDIEVSTYPAGIYLLHISNEAGVTVKKIIKK